MTRLTVDQCRQARMARDARFDGRFFVAVKTTGIFCRPVCPAMLPKESNVEYFYNAMVAAAAGYRPCLRCRPESAPGSWAWRGTATTLHRAITLIEDGALQQKSVADLAGRLGVSDRYLRMLFRDQLGLSPKTYAQIHQLMFAKQLLQTSPLSITDIALSCGFNSVRRFNDAFRKHLRLTPRDIRRGHRTPSRNQLLLAYRPPLNWQHTLRFYKLRLAEGVETITGDRYARTCEIDGARGWFSIEPGEAHQLILTFELSDMTRLRALVTLVRRMFDLDADLATIEDHLRQTSLAPVLSEGLRIPGVASAWEAGVRAILGQQVSVKAAITQLNRLVQTLGTTFDPTAGLQRLFPSPAQVADADLSFLPLPESRRSTLTRFAAFIAETPDAAVDDWATIKGIGPWTLQYVKLRGLSEPDQFLAGDLVVRRELDSLPKVTPADVSPWGSYATFHCWEHAS